MAPAMRFAVALPALAALAWLSTAALRIGEADEVVYRASKEMATWAASGVEPGAQTVAWVRADLERVSMAIPGDATVEEMLGVLATRRTDDPEYLDHALVHFTRAVELRPTSPYTWADIVEAKYRKGDTGKAFEAALRRAAQLGPAEPEVQRTVADFGLAVWDEVTPDTRAAVESMVTGAMKRDAPEILQIAERRGRLAIACRHLPDAPRRADSEWFLLCRSTEATS